MKDWDASACRDSRASTADMVFVLLLAVREAAVAALDSVSASAGESGGPGSGASGTERVRAEPLRRTIISQEAEEKYMVFLSFSKLQKLKIVSHTPRQVFIRVWGCVCVCMCLKVCIEVCVCVRCTILKRAPPG